MEVIHFINGVEVTTPRNNPELTLQVNVDADGIEESVGIKTFEWVDDAAALLYANLQDGTTGGPGVFQSPEHTILLRGSGIEKRLEYIIDTAGATYDRDLVVADSLPKAGPDWLDKAAEITFEYLASLGKLDKDDIVWTPYVISSLPDYKEAFLVSLTMTVVVIELQDLLSEINQAISKLPTVIESVAGIIELIFKIIYAVLLFITLIDLILDLFALIIQRLKYISGMRVSKLLRTGAEHFGLSYEEGVLGSELMDPVILPPLYDPERDATDFRLRGTVNPDNSGQTGYYKGTFGQLLRDLKVLINGRVSVKNGVLRLKSKAERPTEARFQIKPLDQPRFDLNTDELITGYNLTFQTDLADPNTIDNWKGTNVSVKLEAGLDDQQRKAFENFALFAIAFSLIKRKKDLTVPEQIADAFLTGVGLVFNGLVKVANAGLDLLRDIYRFALQPLSRILGFFGINLRVPEDRPSKLQATDLSSLIDDRIGAALLGSDQTTSHKIAIIDEGQTPRSNKVSPLNESILSARNIYSKFYAPANIQAKIVTFENVEMNLQDYENVQEDEAFKLDDGTVAELISCEWNADLSGGVAFTLKGRVPFTYNNNLTEVINEPTGR